MKFKSHKNKAVRCKSKIIVFTSEVYETVDKDEIESLEKAKGVEKMAETKKQKQVD